MDQNFNSLILRLTNTNGDHNYDESFGYQMVRLNQENGKGDIPQSTIEDKIQVRCIDEHTDKNATLTRASTTWTGSKSSVAIIYPCYLCNYETCRSTSLVAHLRQHRQGNFTLETERFQIGKFVCNICNFKTRWLSSLKEHEQKTHFNSNNNTNSTLSINSVSSKGSPFKCRLCGYSTEKLETIGIHMRRHFNSVNIFGNVVHNYPCCLCEFTSRHLEELRNHFNTVHCSSKNYGFQSTRAACTKCDYVFVNSDDMISHLQKHEDNYIPEYPCDFCSYRAASIHLWRDHMESHGGVLEISVASMHH